MVLTLKNAKGTTLTIHVESIQARKLSAVIRGKDGTTHVLTWHGDDLTLDTLPGPRFTEVSITHG